MRDKHYQGFIGILKFLDYQVIENTNRMQQRLTIKKQREDLIKNLKMVYEKAFTKLTLLDLNERDVAKITQIFLLSQEAAITSLEEEIENPLITKSPFEK